MSDDPRGLTIGELATELGLSTQDVLDLCARLGIGATSAGSRLERVHAERVMRRARSESPVPPPESLVRAAERVLATPAAGDLPPEGATPPESMVGRVDWFGGFNRRTGSTNDYGFIKGLDAQSYFVHVSQLRFPSNEAASDVWVVFRPAVGRDGKPSASDVRLLGLDSPPEAIALVLDRGPEDVASELLREVYALLGDEVVLADAMRRAAKGMSPWALARAVRPLLWAKLAPEQASGCDASVIHRILDLAKVARVHPGLAHLLPAAGFVDWVGSLSPDDRLDAFRARRDAGIRAPSGLPLDEALIWSDPTLARWAHEDRELVPLVRAAMVEGAASGDALPAELAELVPEAMKLLESEATSATESSIGPDAVRLLGSAYADQLPEVVRLRAYAEAPEGHWDRLTWQEKIHLSYCLLAIGRAPCADRDPDEHALVQVAVGLHQVAVNGFPNKQRVLARTSELLTGYLEDRKWDGTEPIELRPLLSPCTNPLADVANCEGNAYRGVRREDGTWGFRDLTEDDEACHCGRPKGRECWLLTRSYGYAHVRPEASLPWPKWSLHELLQAAGVTDEDLLAYPDRSGREFVNRFSGTANRYNEIRALLACRGCGGLMRPNRAYARNPAAYSVTVFSCPAGAQGHDVGVYLNHCSGCGSVIDSRDLRCQDEAGFYLCLACGTGSDQAAAARQCPSCCGTQVHRTADAAQCRACSHRWKLPPRARWDR